MSQELKAAYSGASLLIVEGDFPNVFKFRRDALLPEEQKLKNVISTEAYKNITNYLNIDNYISSEEIETYSPLLAYFVVGSVKPNSRKHVIGFPGFDSMILNQATGRKNIAFLETVADLFQGFSRNCPSVTDASDLLNDDHSALAVEKKFDDVHRIGEYIFNGDLENVIHEYENLKSNYKSEEVFHRCSVLPRNIQWAEKISKIITREKSTFIAVGAAHLIGEGSLIEALKKQGFKLEFIEQKK